MTHSARAVAITFLLSAMLTAGCKSDRGANCARSDCQSDSDCPGSRVCRTNLILGRVCIEPNAQECFLGSYGRASSTLNQNEGYGPVFDPFEEEWPNPPGRSTSESME